MNFMDIKRMELEEIERIGGILPKNKLTLVTGLPGTGKTYTTVKFLNQNGIKPIYFNLDNTSIGDLEVEMFDGQAMIELFNMGNDFKDLHGKVVIVDTYSRMESFMPTMVKNHQVAVDTMEKLTDRYGITLIIIGHPEDYVGKDSIFKDNPALIRHCYEHIHFEKKTSSSTKNKQVSITEYFITYITKGRGYTGERIFINWLR